MLGITARLDQKDNGALIVDSGSGMCKVVSRLALCSLWLSAGLGAGRYGPEAQFCNWLVLLVTVHLALCSRLLLSSPRCSASWPVCLEQYRNTGFFWEMTSYVSVFGSLVRQWIVSL